MRKINTDGEIPAHEIYNVFQDSKNYIWFASDAGVWRFDGKTYKGYTAANGLPDNVIFGFFEDTKKRLWLKMYSNKLAYIKNDKIAVLPCNNKLSQIKKSEIISSIYVDDHDTIYISYLRSNEIVKIVPPYKDQNIELIKIETFCGNYIYETPSGGILIGSMAFEESKKLNFDSVALIRDKKYAVFGCKNKYINNPRIMLSKQTDGSYLIGLSNILFQYKNKKLKELVAFNNSILYSIIDRDRNLWVATTDAGLLQFDKTDTTFQSPIKYFPKDFANCILQDKENSYWIVTLKSGLYYAPFNDVSLLNTEHGLSENVTCTHFEKDENKLYVFSHGNLSIMQGKKIERSVDINFSKHETNNIYQVISVGKQKILCLGRQTFLFDKKTRSTEILHSVDKDRLFPRTTNGLTFNDTVFCSGHGTLYLFDKKASTLSITEVFDVKINTLCKLNKDFILIGTERGILKYNIRTKQKTPVNFVWGGSSVIAIEHSKKLHAFFIVLKSGLIYLVDENMKGVIKTSQNINGLTVRRVCTDENGLLWLSTNKGIYTFDTRLHFTCINKEHGLPEDLINHINIANNSVFAASENGLIIFPHQKSFFNHNSPDLYCTGIKINGESRNIDTRYELNYDENFVKIIYQALSYRTNGKVICKYILHGVDEHWNTTMNSSIEYTTLPPGNYNFELYVLNNDNVRSKNSIKINFLVHPPYWETWWFFFLLLCSVLMLFFIVFRIRINQIKKREKEKNELTRKMGETKLLALSSQMHPHFVFNSINSIQHYILANEPLNANKYLTKFSKLMRNVLEQSRKEKITLEEELETVLLYLEMESLRFEDSFDYQIQNNTDQPAGNIVVPPLIIQPLVENAIWHGLLLKKGEKKLSIIVHSDHKHLYIEVDDNGIGREQASLFKSEKVKKESLGIKIIQERLKLLENMSTLKTEIIVVDKYISKNQPNGTKITLKIPLILNTL